jgi:hypothetical protein
MYGRLASLSKSVRRAKFALAPVIAAAVLFAPQHPAQAMAAFAAGIPDNISSRGVAVGAGYNYSTRDGAEARALKECLTQQDAPPDTRALCKVVSEFDNQCLAVSMDPQAGTPGFGWAVANTEDDAKTQALANCRQTAGADRVGACVVSLTDCDTLSTGSK